MAHRSTQNKNTNTSASKRQKSKHMAHIWHQRQLPSGLTGPWFGKLNTQKKLSTGPGHWKNAIREEGPRGKSTRVVHGSRQRRTPQRMHRVGGVGAGGGSSFPSATSKWTAHAKTARTIRAIRPHGRSALAARPDSLHGRPERTTHADSLCGPPSEVMRAGKPRGRSMRAVRGGRLRGRLAWTRAARPRGRSACNIRARSARTTPADNTRDRPRNHSWTRCL